MNVSESIENCLPFSNYQVNIFFIYIVVIVCIGAHAFDIIASDPEGDPLTYKLSGPQASVFSADPATGRVTLSGVLDREV